KRDSYDSLTLSHPRTLGTRVRLVAVTGATGSGSEGACRGSWIKGKRDHAQRESRGATGS
ncbi:Uncharacterized protein DBV15_09725, partial [Temnothorax longispinosus]